MWRTILLASAAWMLARSPGLAQTGASPAEAALLAMANAQRSAYGLAELGWDPSLARAAREHASRVAAEPGELLHQYPGEPDVIRRAARQGAHLEMIAENLARGGRVPAELEDIWMRTPVHRANILDGRMTSVGIGVVERRGILYAVEDFGRTVTVPQREQVEAQVAGALRASGIASIQVTDSARRSCEQGGEAPTDARMVVQWDGPDPARLPDALLVQIHRKIYGSVALGACPSPEPNRGFTTYRVAALLY